MYREIDIFRERKRKMRRKEMYRFVHEEIKGSDEGLYRFNRKREKFEKW